MWMLSCWHWWWKCCKDSENSDDHDEDRVEKVRWINSKVNTLPQERITRLEFVQSWISSLKLTTINNDHSIDHDHHGHDHRRCEDMAESSDAETNLPKVAANNLSQIPDDDDEMSNIFTLDICV